MVEAHRSCGPSRCNTPPIKSGAIAPSYEASLVKLRVMTWSVVASCHMVGCSRSARDQRVRGAVVPRAGRWLCRDALPTTSYPCRQGSPDTPFRVRHDKRVLDRCGRPIYGIGAGSHRPAQGANGRPRPRDGMRHAIWLCSPPLSSPDLSHRILLFDPRRGHSSVPTTAGPQRRAQTSSRLARRAIRR